MCYVFCRSWNKKLHQINKEIKDSMPLFVLGIIRSVMYSSIGYDYSVIEYGLHWNFFLTLGVVKVMYYIIFHFQLIHFIL